MTNDKKKLLTFFLFLRHQKPFTDGEMVKSILIDTMDNILRKHKDRNKILNTIKSIQLSPRTITRRIAQYSDYVREELKQKIANAVTYSICLDESTDCNDQAQLIVWIRIVNSNLSTQDEMLDLSNLGATTKAKDIFSKVMDIFEEFDISINKLASITTDGASSMVGKHAGFVALMKKENPFIKSVHCLIHQESLIAKLGTPEAKKVCDKVMQITNKCISSGAHRHREFKDFLDESETEINDLCQMQQVRWLSAQKVLNSFVLIFDQVDSFLKNLATPIIFPELNDFSWREDVAFFADLTKHFSELNLLLQGNSIFSPCILKFKIRQRKIYMGFSYVNQ